MRRSRIGSAQQGAGCSKPTATQVLRWTKSKRFSAKCCKTETYEPKTVGGYRRRRVPRFPCCGEAAACQCIRPGNRQPVMGPSRASQSLRGEPELQFSRFRHSRYWGPFLTAAERAAFGCNPPCCTAFHSCSHCRSAARRQHQRAWHTICPDRIPACERCEFLVCQYPR